MMYLNIKHTDEVYGLNYKYEDGTPVKLGDIVSVPKSMAITLQTLHWGRLVSDEEIKAELVKKIAERAED